MDRRQRVMLLGIAAAIAVAAVVIALVASGGDDDGDKSTSSSAAQTETTTADSGGLGTSSTEVETTPPEPEATTATIDLKGGEPDGGVEDVKLKKDDQLEITVNSDQELPIHFHGYDVEKDAAPGKPAVFKLEADNEGVFAIEVESTGTKIAEVTVEP